MNDEMAAVQKHLGIRIVDGQLNHYTLLGLDRNASANEIKQALRTAVNAWNQSDTKSDPVAAQSVAKLIKQAQSVLLDESRRREYDLSWSAANVPEGPSLFPEADPYAAFEPSECLVGASASSATYGSASERWSELTQRIPLLLNSEFSSDSHPNAVFENDGVVQATQSQAGTSIRAATAVSRVEQLKRKRQLTQRVYLVGFMVIALAFLGYAGFRFAMNRIELAQRLEDETHAPKMNSAPSSNSMPSQPKDRFPKTIGGGLAPKGGQETSDFVLPTLRKEESTDVTPKEFTESNPFGTTSKPSEAMPPSMEPGPDVPITPAPATAPPMSMSPAGMTPEESKPMPTLPANSKAEWTAAMRAAKKAVDQADFKTFHEQMKIALPLSTNNEMSDKRARLDQLGQLYEIFIKAVQDAKSKMRGAETLSVGKTLISIVEIKADELIVRAGGENKRYPWDRLPPGIASAMADFSLSDQEPTDLAARAVYFSLSPARNDLYAKKVKDWFEKSVGKGDIRKDLVQALTDTYE